MAVRVYVEEAGCDRRRLDAETIRRFLEANGYELVASPTDADRILAVVCAFKEKQEDESVRRLRSLRKYGRPIVVYGCLADIAADRYTEFTDLPSVSPREIATIDRHFEAANVPFAAVPDANTFGSTGTSLVRAKRRVESAQIPWQETVDWLHRPGPGRFNGRLSRSDEPFNLFVSRGCLGSCTYCGIRRAIGPVRSKPVRDVVAELDRGLAEGYRTFNILADDPGCYGLDISEALPGLLSALFETLESAGVTGSNGTGPASLHIREIHPKYLVAYGQRLAEMPGFGLVGTVLCPIQSGSNRVLELMQREHTATQLADVLHQLKLAFPLLRLETQMIVGFPTETEAEFEETLDFVRDTGFDSVVVFPYDPKERTAASALDGHVPPEVIRRRMKSAFRYFRREGIDAYYSCP
jgi:tRNA A37 methylthiotransferase MiaB